MHVGGGGGGVRSHCMVVHYKIVCCFDLEGQFSIGALSVLHLCSAIKLRQSFTADPSSAAGGVCLEELVEAV